MKYFFDNCISPRLVRMLAALDKDVVHLRDVYDADVKDEVFLHDLHNQCDVYITHDHRQKTRSIEARALASAGVTAIWLGPFWSKMIAWDQAKWLIHRWETIEAFSSSVKKGTLGEIAQKGKISTFSI